MIIHSRNATFGLTPMRSRFALVLSLVLGIGLAAQAAAQACTGLCLQQVSCSNGATSTISGIVYAPNGTDPLPGVLVYIPNAAVAAFTPGVSCAVAGQPPSGSPLVGTTTAVDGSFTLANVPVGNNIPLVVQSGRWRRQVTVPSTASCGNTAFSTRFPQNQSEGDIPKIAVVTGSADSVECVLRKVGVADTEFTDGNGSGRINLFTATNRPGAILDSQTTAADALLDTQGPLNNYDVLMLPCEGAPYQKNAGALTNLVQFANSGGRVYASHFSYDWLYENPPFNTVVNWTPASRTPPDGLATVDTSFAQGQTLSQWLGIVGATTTPSQVLLTTVRHDLSGVVAPTQSWLTLNNAAFGNPIMQFTFQTPVASPTKACGRVLFNEYHVENPIGGSRALKFPSECAPGAMTAQEKLLEFSLFDLTGDGTAPTLTPSPFDFGTEPVGSTTGVQRFFWTNNTFFSATVSAATTVGDFKLITNSCTNVSVGASCELDVAFAPTALGVHAGTLTVVANTGSSTATLSGTGISPLTVSNASLTFGKVDVGATASQTLTISNVTAATLPLANPATTGDFRTTSTCAAVLAGHSSCTVTVSFEPSTTGTRTGTLNLGLVANASVSGALVSSRLTGTGVDFSEAVGPVSAQTVAGLPIATTSTTAPIAGFENAVTLTCTTTAPASTCAPVSDGFTPATAVTDAVTISTTSQYTVVGASLLRDWWLTWLAAGTSLLLLRKRRSAGMLTRLGVFILCALAVGSSLTGCSGKDPAQNNPYTPAGTYTYTVTVTDGFLVHAATYTLVVKAK